MTATTAAISPYRRQGFTLVEVLVAMALIIFIMVILTEAFSAGTGVFRTLKAQGDMQEKLRSVTSLLRDDLRQTPGRQYHFDVGDGTLGTLGINNPNSPTKGYFYIQQPAQQLLPAAMQFGSMPEGVDGFNVPSVRMNSPVLTLNGANQLVSSGASTPAFLPALCFTINRRGTQPQDYFAARIPGPPGSNPAVPPFNATEQTFFNLNPMDYQQPVPGNAAQTAQTPLLLRTSPTTQSGLLLSQWAEVGYFLVPTGLAAGTTSPVPTYSLRRRLRVVLTDTTTIALVNGPIANRIPATLWGSRYSEVSCLPDTSTGSAVLFFNSPKDLTIPPAFTNLNTTPPFLLPPCGVAGQGCQVLVPPLSPVALPQQQTPLPQPQLVQQSLVPLASSPPANAQQQGQNDWAGDDILVTDVISFNVRVLAQSRTTGLYSPDFLDLTDPTLGLNPPGFYNTGTLPPPAFTITALEITIRVWDTKTSQTRQVTLVQDM